MKLKAKAQRNKTFDFQNPASGLGKLGTDFEAELSKIPALDLIEAIYRANDNAIVITIRGKG